jgi:hypothetical protein
MEGGAVGHNIERGPPKGPSDGPWVGPFQIYVWQPCPPFKMAAVTKNRNFFNCPLLLYYKSKWAQIVTAATLQW